MEQIGDVPPELAAEYRSFSTNCSKCHGLDRALAAPVTDTRHWDIYVAKMMRTAGSAIHPDEAAPILRFLYWYTGKKNSRVEDGQAKTAEDAIAPAPSEVAPPATPAGSQPDAPASAPSVSTDTEGETKP